MTEELEARTMAFLRSVASYCSNCLKVKGDNCNGCIATWAKLLLRDANMETRVAPDLVAMRSQRIQILLDQIKQAKGRPVRARNIICKGISRQLKYWTLRKMEASGLVTRKIYRGESWYSLG